jgi:hypothetical protein
MTTRKFPDCHTHGILLGCNPNPGPNSGWSKLTGRKSNNLKPGDYHADGWWSVGCHQNEIDPGDVGYITYADGSYGNVGGLMICTGEVVPVQEKYGVVDYARGTVWRWPLEYVIDGARIMLDPNWSGRAPFGKVKRYCSGEFLKLQDEAVILDLMHPFVEDWMNIHVSLLTGITSLDEMVAS